MTAKEAEVREQFKVIRRSASDLSNALKKLKNLMYNYFDDDHNLTIAITDGQWFDVDHVEMLSESVLDIWEYFGDYKDNPIKLIDVD